MNIENGNRMWVNLQILVLFIYIFERQQMFWKKKQPRKVCVIFGKISNFLRGLVSLKKLLNMVLNWQKLKTSSFYVVEELLLLIHLHYMMEVWIKFKLWLLKQNVHFNFIEMGGFLHETAGKRNLNLL